MTALSIRRIQRPRAIDTPAVRGLLVAALVALPFAAMLLRLDQVIEGDEGVYATIARSILDGGVPYRDLFDNKPPLQYAWFSAGLVLFGDNAEALRLTTALVMSATAIPVYVAGRMLFSPWGGWVALGVFSGSQLIVPNITEGPPETLMLLPHLAAFVMLLVGLRTGRRWSFFLAGLLFGLAVLTKPVAIWPALAFVPGTILLTRGGPGGAPLSLRTGWRRGLIAALWYVAGGAIALVVVISPFAVIGALPDLFDALVAFNLEMGSELTAANRLERLGESLLDVLGNPAVTALLSSGVLGLALAVLSPARRHREHVAFLLFSATTVLGMASTGYFFVHHYVQLFPVLALGCAAGIAALPHIARTAPGRLALLGAFGIVVFVPTAVSVAAPDRRAVPQPSDPSQHSAVPPERRASLTDEQLRAVWSARDVDLGAYLRANTDEDDRIYVHGRATSRAPVYFYAERAPAARYFYEWPLRLRPDEIVKLVEELRISRPRFIVDAFNVDYRYVYNDEADVRPQAFLTLLEEEYEYVGTMHFADVYRRIDP